MQAMLERGLIAAAKECSILARRARTGWRRPGSTSTTGSRRAAAEELDGVRDRLRLAAGAPRPLIRYCVDWSEQRHHLAGALGAALTDADVRARLGTRARTSRAVHLTDEGRRGLRGKFGLELASR